MLHIRYDVFLSYSRSDTDRVEPLLEELRRMGYRVFFDVQSIDPGERWKKRLERSIRASRTLVLCWSEHTRSSDYITFEYSRAEALHKPVFPWLMDATPLPAMLEIQGLTSANPSEVASALRPKLGWPMWLRWTRQAVFGICFAIALVLGVWKKTHPTPREFAGRIVDAQTLEGISGATVKNADLAGNRIAITDESGVYRILLTQPQPNYIHLQCTKNGYMGEERSFSTREAPDDWPLEKLQSR